MKNLRGRKKNTKIFKAFMPLFMTTYQLTQSKFFQRCEVLEIKYDWFVASILTSSLTMWHTMILLLYVERVTSCYRLQSFVFFHFFFRMLLRLLRDKSSAFVIRCFIFFYFCYATTTASTNELVAAFQQQQLVPYHSCPPRLLLFSNLCRFLVYLTFTSITTVMAETIITGSTLRR